MTMLVSFYSSEGIVFAADSQITSPGKAQALTPQQKVFKVRGVGDGDGLMGYFGLAQVNGHPLAPWLRERFREWSGGSAVELGRFLTDSLTADATKRELRCASGIHIGAFEKREGSRVPVFVFARNIDLADDGYHVFGGYRVDEQLPADYFRDVPPRDLRKVLRHHARVEGIPFWLRNGDLWGFSPVWDGIERAAKLLVGQTGYRTPNALDEWERLARTLIVTTSQVYRILYCGGAPLVGNRVRVVSLPWSS